MLERIVKAKGAEFTCTTCNSRMAAGETAHIQMHVERAKQRPSKIHVGFAPNEEPKRVIVAPFATIFVEHTRCRGRHIVITRKECDACDTKVKLATLRRNCFI